MHKKGVIVLNVLRVENCVRPRERNTAMIIEFVILGALAATAVVGAIVTTIRDGYRRVPTRRA
jgi:hypothetical protein